MSLYRFFVDESALTKLENGQVAAARITGEEAEHAARVLRLTPGEQVVVCDGTGRECLSVLRTVSARECYAKVTAQRMCPAEPHVPICLFQGLAKGDKMEWVIQKCTELGVAEIYPVSTTYSIVRLDEEKAGTKAKRWERVAREAAKQCGRAVPPRIYPVMKLEDAVAAAQVQRVFVPWEGAAAPLQAALAGLQEQAGDSSSGRCLAGVVIGPEGGLASDEVCSLEQLGAVPVTLGPRILRTETAAIAAITAVQIALGEFGGSRSMDEWR